MPRIATLALCTATIALAACGGGDSTESSTTTTTKPPGPPPKETRDQLPNRPHEWKRYVNDRGGFALLLPRGWNPNTRGKVDPDPLVRPPGRDLDRGRPQSRGTRDTDRRLREEHGEGPAGLQPPAADPGDPTLQAPIRGGRGLGHGPVVGRHRSARLGDRAASRRPGDGHRGARRERETRRSSQRRASGGE